jgi:hypothetical protein
LSTQRYSVTPHTIETILNWVKVNEIAIPEIQRPFVWENAKVRDLLDSLYLGYPVGYLIAWKNPNVRLKDGSSASGKRILIDGQQRVTALMASLLGKQVLNKDYETVRVKIAFNPQEEKFEVSNPAIEKDKTWITDVSLFFAPDASQYKMIKDYVALNPECNEEQVSTALGKLNRIASNHVGIIELADDLDIETVTEIFIRVNSAGAQLSQADFVMSKIAANEIYGGVDLRKTIDYFCHVSIAPEFLNKISTNDKKFAESNFLPQIKWLSNFVDDIYDPTYTDVIRVAFTSEFGRGKLQDLVALLSGRNFETKVFEESIAEESFKRFTKGVEKFINETNFKRFIMILRSAGFISNSLMGGQNAINFAYIIFLYGRQEKIDPSQLETLVRQWYVMSTLTQRYTGSPETAFDYDMRMIKQNGLASFVKSVVAAELSDPFWASLLPQVMDTSAIQSTYWRTFVASQVKSNDLGFLSTDITVRDLVLLKSDLHHIYPKNYLKKQDLSKGQYNQIANFAVTQTEINIAISDKNPDIYFEDLLEQVEEGKKKYGGITDKDTLIKNLEMHAIPSQILEESINYFDFLELRRKLMAQKLKTYFNSLGDIDTDKEGKEIDSPIIETNNWKKCSVCSTPIDPSRKRALAAGLCRVHYRKQLRSK